MTLAQHVSAYSVWRSGLSEQITQLREWLSEADLHDVQTDQRLQRLLEKLREDRLQVAFVAEFSRGKSELINAIFFADQGNRMLPSSAGRTTMCPTELLYVAGEAPTLSLLPIETRASNAGIAEYKRYPEEWVRIALDTGDSAALQAALRRVAEVRRVTPDEAESLGFPLAEDSPLALAIGDDGQVDIPCWRHAIINYPHPLLENGLVILDTPGLNAIGTEPELTMSLLPASHAALFILAADTGVTQSDLDFWRTGIVQASGQRGRLVVLNKIDSLWDDLRKGQEIDDEITRQVHAAAATLRVPEGQVFPVSAQKGLVAKINQDKTLLARSRLPELEAALTQALIPAKRQIVGESVATEIDDVVATVRVMLDTRLAGLREQLEELCELRGKNRNVVTYMMGKVKGEKSEFEESLQRYYAVRSIFSNLTNRLFGRLGLDALRDLTRKTREQMEGSRLSGGLSDAISAYFRTVKGNLKDSSGEIGEITNMMDVMYKKFSIEHGLKLGTPSRFSLLGCEKEVGRIEQWCGTHLNTLGSLLTRGQKTITQKFFEEVALQVRRAFEQANRDAETWLRAVMAPMETQVRERQLQLKRRLESIKRIHQATDTLDERVSELTQAEEHLTAQLSELGGLRSCIEDLLREAKQEVAAA